MKLRILPVLLALLAPLCLLAAGPVRKGAVTAELVSAQASIQPGSIFRVALQLAHDAHWHSYWINPGTGYPTSLTWKLPPGFQAGDLVWPTPHVVRDTHGNITGNGYEGTVLFFIDVQAPADLPAGQPVTLRAKADWLMCSEVCMPGGAELELTLPVTATAPAPNPAVAATFASALADLPRPLAGWRLAARRSGDQFIVTLAPDTAGTPAPAGLHLFDEAGLVDYAAPQVVTTENGLTVLTLKAAPEAAADARRLKGVLVSAGGWGSATRLGATFDVELGAPLAAPAPAPAPRPAAATSLAGTLLLAFVGGLILNLMPCVFPVLGIKVLGFVNQAGSDRSKIVAHGLTFAAGVLLSFWTLAGLLLVLRAGGAQLGWGFQLQSPAFVFGMTAFLFAFALNLSGLFEFGLGATAVGGKLQMQQGYAGSFFTGILATLVATPCSAPFLAPALGAALTLSAVESFAVFTAIALGLSLPYLLLSAFPAAVKLLPRPGAWMETFKQFMAFPLYATVGWLLWVLAGQTKDNDYALLYIAFGLVLVALAAWLYGRFHGTLARAAAAAALLGGLWVGWPAGTEPAPATPGGFVVKWEHWSPEALAAARAAGRTVYVDFTARWCATCQTNKAAVFSSQEVLAEFGRRKVLLLKADWTSRDPAITAELAKWNRSAVPFNLIYAGPAEPVILPELLTPSVVLESLARAK